MENRAYYAAIICNARIVGPIRFSRRTKNSGVGGRSKERR